MATQYVEFLVAFTDNTWDTVVEKVDVPDELSEDEKTGWLTAWAQGALLDPKKPRQFHQEVAMLAVYCEDLEDFDPDDPRIQEA